MTAPSLPPFPDDRYRHAVVVATHADDVPLALSGLLQQLHERGTAIDLVVTDNGAPLCASLRAQGLTGVDVHRLALCSARDGLAGLLADADVCFVPWPGDQDRRASSEIALDVAPVTTHRWTYPAGPGTAGVPALAFAHRLTPTQRQRKAAGIAALTSRPPGDADDVEVVFRAPPSGTAPVSRFAELYAGGVDPWGVGTKWYERRKRAVLLAALPHERYGVAVEPACGNGMLTEALAGRCERVHAFDPVPAAVALARDRTAGRPNVTVAEAGLPHGLPAGPVDLVVFSEILYYLGDDDLAATVDATVAALRPGGHVVAAHWLPWAPEAPRDGLAAHRFLLDRPELTSSVEHRDERFVLHVLSRR